MRKAEILLLHSEIVCVFFLFFLKRLITEFTTNQHTMREPDIGQNKMIK